MNSFQVLSNFARRTPTLLHALSVSPPAPIDIDSTPDSAIPIPHDENSESRNAKLSHLLNDLKIHDLNVTPQLKHALIGVVDRCLDAFAKDDDDLGHTSVVEHTINTGDSPPIKEKHQPLPHPLRSFADKELERYIRLGIIRKADPGKCQWAAAIVIVNKKEYDLAKLLETLRMCHDYRKFNFITIKDAYPLPRIEDMITGLCKAKYFVSLDRLMGYHQISVKEADRPKTGFVTHRGLFMFNRMPFGLCNAPATFQRLMDSPFETKIGKELLVYLDDILIFAEAPEELLAALERTLQILVKAGLKFKHRKCQLFRPFLEYLGYVISGEGIKPDPKKIEKIRNWPTPSTGTEMHSFLGLCNYYRKLIPQFADLSSPLYELTSQTKLEITPELLNAFDALKTAMGSTAALLIPDPTLPFILETDASNVA